LGSDAWERLPSSVQRRFGRALALGESVTYMGEISATQRSPIGCLWAQLLRSVGSPLPLRELAHTASIVVVTADSADSQCWTRIYHEPGHLPQVVRSMKRFSGPTGLEERVGGGIGMALTVSVEAGALVFRSAGYHWCCGNLRLPIPAWLTPGCMEIRHREESAGRFSFTLSVAHPWWGQIIHQIAYFQDATQ
jgi:hypothetical protein